MKYTEAEYKNLIEHAPVFGIDRVKDDKLFIGERTKFISLLFGYFQEYGYLGALNTGEKNNKWNLYGDIFVVTACRCIEKYKKSQESCFINYFSASLKAEKTRKVARERKAKALMGGKRGRKYDKILSLLSRTAKSRQREPDDEEVINFVHTVYEIPMREIGQALNLGRVSQLSAEDEAHADSRDGAREELKRRIENVESEFEKNKSKNKPLLKKLLTAEFVKNFDKAGLNPEYLRGYAFIDEEMLSKEDMPTQRQLAESAGFTEAYASKILKEFMQKCTKS